MIIYVHPNNSKASLVRLVRATLGIKDADVSRLGLGPDALQRPVDGLLVLLPGYPGQNGPWNKKT